MTPPTKQTKIKVWHFLKEDRKLQWGDDKRIVEPGMGFSVDPDKIQLCQYGLHGSTKPLDALNYAPGPILTECELSGKILYGNDKLCAEKRKVLWVYDATDLLHVFACDVARDALDLIPQDQVDERSLKAIEVKLAWLRGEATDDELSAARNAAWAARDAARDVARDVARDADLAAAWAAWDADLAARAAARAARDASDARDAQNKHLEQMIADARIAEEFL